METEKILKAYTSFYNLNLRAPYSLAELAKSSKLKEDTLIKAFSSISKIRESVLENVIGVSIERLDADVSYSEFSAREKVLALFYTLFEEFKSERSYFVAVYKKPNQLRDSVKDFKLFFKHFDARCESILQEGIEKDELKYRRFIGDHYAKGFKLSFTYIFRVWMSDESEENQQTDAAIEKSINLAFDLLQSTSFDSILDFGRFAVKTRV